MPVALRVWLALALAAASFSGVSVLAQSSGNASPWTKKTWDEIQDELPTLFVGKPGVKGICLNKKTSVAYLFAQDKQDFFEIESELATRGISMKGTQRIRTEYFEILASKDSQDRHRPAKIGVRIDRNDVTSRGTVACRVRDRNGDFFALSAFHVMAEGADGVTEIVQPGDSGVAEKPCLVGGTDDDSIARPTRWGPLWTSDLKPNAIDAAIARTRRYAQKDGKECLINETLGGAKPSGSNLEVQEVLENWWKQNKRPPVTKYGQITDVTSGDLVCQGTFRVKLGSTKYLFKRQLGIVGEDGEKACASADYSVGSFACPGDSGSIVVAPLGKDGLRPTGLLFARGRTDSGEKYYLANPIEEVLCCLDVVIDDGTDKWKSIEPCTDCRHPAIKQAVSGFTVATRKSMADGGLTGVLANSAEELLGAEGVIGIAKGSCQARPCIRVYIRGDLAERPKGIPLEIEGFEVHVVRGDGFEGP